MTGQHAPRGVTIVVALIFLIVGIAGTFLGLIPHVGGFSGETIGVVSYVLATAVMLLGVFARGV
jgi:hypothetical protein